LTEREPSIIGVGALFAKATGITDYQKITTKMAELFADLGGEIRYRSEVQGIVEGDDLVEIHLATDSIITCYVLACGG
jgi:L-2-hydroxyglutarate oxidase